MFGSHEGHGECRVRVHEREVSYLCVKLGVVNWAGLGGVTGFKILSVWYILCADPGPLLFARAVLSSRSLS